MATSLKHGPRMITGAKRIRKRHDLLAEVDRHAAIPAQRGRDLSWLTRWMPDLDDPIRAAHEKTWGLMAVAGAVIAGGLTMAMVERPEFGVWLAALLGAFAGILVLPLLAILVRLSLFLALGGAVVSAFLYFA